MEKEATQTERRQFLFRGMLWTALGVLGASLAWIFEDLWTAASRFSTSRWIPVAPLNQFPLDGVFPFPEYKVAIVRMGAKMGAISLECTHLGCLVNVLDRGFFCPCHGSDFGPLGQVYSGPATEALPWHELMNRDGRIWVRLGERSESPQWLEAKV
jgi:nitrite reductase/ring-hydroxylating ferredoxin subunit